MSDLPVACTLDLTELIARRDTLLPGLVAQAIGYEVLPDGMRWHPLIGNPIVRRTWALWDSAARRRDLAVLVAALDAQAG